MSKYQHHKVWLDGRIVPPEQATISIFTQTALRGANVYEGLRAYWDDVRQDMLVWKLKSHVRRLFRNMKVMRLTIPYSEADLQAAVVDWIRANDFRTDIHFRLVAYFGDGGPAGVRGYKPDEIDSGAFISGGPRPHGPALEKGLEVCISSWRRINDDSVPPRIKAGANYQNSRLAGVEARVNGYDDAIFLNRDGKVAEATGACIMMVQDGVLVSPPVTEGILDSLTRKVLAEMFEAAYGTKAVERQIDRTELYTADEVFMCGSAEEVTPVISIDRIPIGDGAPGPITRRLQSIYSDATRGRDQRYAADRTAVYNG